MKNEIINTKIELAINKNLHEKGIIDKYIYLKVNDLLLKKLKKIGASYDI